MRWLLLTPRDSPAPLAREAVSGLVFGFGPGVSNGLAVPGGRGGLPAPSRQKGEEIEKLTEFG